MVKKRKKKKNYFYEFADVFLILGLIVVGFFIFKSCDNKKDEEKAEPKKEEVTPVKELTEEEKKLLKLNNINERLDFFKMDYLDRYIEYKEKNPNLDIEKVVVYVNIGLDQEFYTNIKESPNKNTNIVLANKFYSLGSNYVPDNLKTINSKYSVGDRKLQSDACDAFEELSQAAKEEGYTVKAASTYRSYSYQEGLYNKYKNSDGEKKADTYSARAGHSEHQTGLAVDVTNDKTSYTNFGSTKEFTWMKDNAYKYGFILRYTKETEFITGYMDEPWHYRYVGKEIAEYIQNNPMTYEEYYVRFLDK